MTNDLHTRLAPALAFLLFLFMTACGGSQGGNSDAALPATDGGASACIGQAACACRTAPGCQIITESCWCPSPECGPGACVCGGGKFLGCAPTTSACDSTVTCRPAGRYGAQDARGCVACSYQSDCQKAFDQMTETCASKKNVLTAFRCGNKPDCVTKCINDLATCDDIGCGLCAQCGCASVGPFERCVSACQM